MILQIDEREKYCPYQDKSQNQLGKQIEEAFHQIKFTDEHGWALKIEPWTVQWFPHC